MPKPKTKKITPPVSPSRVDGTEYRGKQAKTGNSLGFRFDRALFKSHPEFNGEVSAKVIAPGRMLVSAKTTISGQDRNDAVVGAFLAFLAKEMQRSPQSIKPLDETLVNRVAMLVEGVAVAPEEDLGDEALL
jgi:antitoxin PrlF